MRKSPPDPESGLRERVHRGARELARLTDSLRPTVCLGLSGGMDSMLLLELLAGEHAARTIKLSALYVDHGLSSHAAQWGEYCGRACERHGIEFKVMRVKVERAGGESLEEEARHARYGAFDRLPSEIVALAHHADDLAETVLLQLLRGSGPKGLAAMAEVVRSRRPSGAHVYWRPLLHVERRTIASVATGLGLAWVEDESNRDLTLRRNYVRHRVLPVIAAGFPMPAPMLARAARLQAEAAELLDDLADVDLARLGEGAGIDCRRLTTLSQPRQANVLRRWLAGAGARAPSSARLAALLRAVGDSSNDTRLEWVHEEWRVVRRRHLLLMEPRRLVR